MHNLYAIFAKILNICKQVAGNLVNESVNVPRRGVVPKFSDLEIVALNMTSEAVGIDSESLLFAKLQEYSNEIPNLISRRQYNDRRKITSSLWGRRILRKHRQSYTVHHKACIITDINFTQSAG